MNRRKPPRRTTIISIGYEGRTADEMIAVLRAHRVSRLLDIRELPLSRRKEFSKTALAERLRVAGIEYRHVRIAGNPHRRLHADTARCLAMYERHLRRHPEVIQVFDAERQGRRVAVMCVERAHDRCHRSRLLDELQAQRPKLVTVVCIE